MTITVSVVTTRTVIVNVDPVIVTIALVIVTIQASVATIQVGVVTNRPGVVTKCRLLLTTPVCVLAIVRPDVTKRTRARLQGRPSGSSFHHQYLP